MYFYFINIYLFILSFVFGLIYMYFNKNKKKDVFVYPTPDNLNKIQYKDLADNCFQFKSTPANCTNDSEVIPIQY
jgi:hypothetical protein